MSDCLNDSKVRTLQLPVKFLFLCLLTIPPWVNSRAAETNPIDQWYQVELIVFTLTNPMISDEIWPVDALSYPANMVSVSPLRDSAITPYTLAQLEQVLALGEPRQAGGSMENNNTPDSDYIFSSRSRLKLTKPQSIKPSGSLTEDGPTGVVHFEPGDLDELFEQEQPDAFRNINTKNRLLNGIVRSINRSSLFKLMLHQSWLQPVLTRDKAFPVLVQTGKHYDDNYEIDGTINISRSRYLHVDTDLWYTEFAPNYSQQPSQLPLNLTADMASQYPAVVTWESERGNYVPIQTHRLKQSRRMRSSTLHYIDHPFFGIIVRVDEFTIEEPED